MFTFFLSVSSYLPKITHRMPAGVRRGGPPDADRRTRARTGTVRAHARDRTLSPPVPNRSLTDRRPGGSRGPPSGIWDRSIQGSPGRRTAHISIDGRTGSVHGYAWRPSRRHTDAASRLQRPHRNLLKGFGKPDALIRISKPLQEYHVPTLPVILRWEARRRGYCVY